MPSATQSGTAASSGEIDLELLTFVERFATNLARWDLLLFFGRHPSTRGSALAIARNVGRRPQSVEKELEDLVYLGILNAQQNAGGLTYQLSRSSSTRRAVIRLAARFGAAETVRT